MGGNSASNDGSNDTQVSGYEREINKQKAKEKAQKEAFGKYDKSNTNPNNNIQTQKKSNVNLGGGGGGDNNGNQVVQAPVPKVDAAPTTAEVSQVKTNAEDPLEIRKRKVMAKGRSPTILTGVRGVEEGLTLGKPSLLGRA